MPRKKTSTSLLCELTRLKSQQKYLECSQIKINFNIKDKNDNNNDNDNNDDNYDKQNIKDIENLKNQLENQFIDYRDQNIKNIQDIQIFINAIKNDIMNDENLKNCSVNNLRERIVGINTHLNKLQETNYENLKILKNNCENYEKEIKEIFFNMI